MKIKFVQRRNCHTSAVDRSALFDLKHERKVIRSRTSAAESPGLRKRRSPRSHRRSSASDQRSSILCHQSPRKYYMYVYCALVATFHLPQSPLSCFSVMCLRFPLYTPPQCLLRTVVRKCPEIISDTEQIIHYSLNAQLSIRISSPRPTRSSASRRCTRSRRRRTRRPAWRTWCSAATWSLYPRAFTLELIFV